MPFTLRPPGSRTGLAVRLGDLGQARKRVAVTAGTFAFVGTAVGLILLYTFLDAALHLGSLPRAFALASTLVAAGVVWFCGVAAPMRWPTSPLSVALEIEERYPKLNDALASAVDFQNAERQSGNVSARFRTAAVRTAEKLAERQNLQRMIPTSRLWRAVWFCAVVLAAGVPLALWKSDRTAVALARFADPFGSHPWPPKTRIEILSPQSFPHRMPKDEVFELRFAVRGEIPGHAELLVRVDGGNEFTKAYPLVQDADVQQPGVNDSSASTKNQRERQAFVTVKLDPSDVSRHFSFRVRANDGDTGWQSVVVVSPPRLVSLNGRASPQIHIEPPRYTGFEPLDLPDGSAVIEVPTGTRVRLRAASDVPLSSAVLAYTGDRSAVARAAPLAHLGLTDPIAALGARLVADSLSDDIPAQLSRDGRTLEWNFTPAFPGTYALRLTNESGLSGTRLLDVRIIPDPAPSVTLVRPAASKDPAVLIPSARLTVQVTVDDKVYALRRVFLEYRVGKDGLVRTFPLSDMRRVREWLPIVGGGPAYASSAQPIRYEGTFTIAIHELLSNDGMPVREGDTLILWAAADDWDDVTVLKDPGRSEPVTIHIVSKETAEAFLLEQLTPLRTEIVRVRNQQRDTFEKVMEVRSRFDPAKPGVGLDKLLTLEQAQSQIRGKIADSNDGLRTKADLLRETARINGLTGTPTGDRIEAVASGLDRIAERDLAAIEPLLAEARQRSTRPGDKDVTRLLDKAANHQQEVDDALTALLDVLASWGGAGEIRGEAKMLRDAVLREAGAADLLPMRVPAGKPPQALDPDQRATLDHALNRLHQLAERADALIARASKLAAEKDQSAIESRVRADARIVGSTVLQAQAATLPPNSPAHRELMARADRLRTEASDLRARANHDSAEAAALRRALTEADENPDDAEARMKALAAASGWAAAFAVPPNYSSGQILVNELREARRELDQNRPGQAAPLERSAAARLDRLAAVLEEKDSGHTPEQARKLRSAADQLDALAAAEFDLQKRITDANRETDPAARAEKLKSLAEEQKRLLEQGKDLALRLTRERADNAVKDVQEAVDKMQVAKDDLERGKNPSKAPREAVEKLDDARDKLDKSGAKAAKEQTDDKRRKLADRVKVLLAEQKAIIVEAARLEKEAAESKGWDRVLLGKYAALQERENLLAVDVRALVPEFVQYPVFARLLSDGAGAMENAGFRVEARKRTIIDADPSEEFDAKREKLSDERVRRPMGLAVRRLEQVLASLEDAAPKQPDAKGANTKDSGPKLPAAPPQSQPGNENQIVPPLAQLKALRALQSELNERTLAFDKAHPDRSKLNEDEQDELKELEDSQRELAALFEHVAKLFEKTMQPDEKKEKP